jgi:hypothetical protein
MMYTLMIDDGSTDACDLDREFYTLQGMLDYIYDLSPDGREIDHFVVHWSDESRFCWDLVSLESFLDHFDPLFFEHFAIFVVGVGK